MIHCIVLSVLIELEEMDGTIEQSAEIARENVYDAIANYNADADVEVVEYYEGDTE